MSNKKITKKQVEKRVQDWKGRIVNLHSLISKWLKNNPEYSIKNESSIEMYEELMQKFQVPKESIKILDIYYKNHIIATIKPIGLWIVGTNGRLDILYKGGSVTLVDKSEQFKEPEWFAYGKIDKNKGNPFNQKYFQKILRNN